MAISVTVNTAIERSFPHRTGFKSRGATFSKNGVYVIQELNTSSGNTIILIKTDRFTSQTDQQMGNIYNIYKELDELLCTRVRRGVLKVLYKLPG